jgi:hypothetical protein
MTLAPSHFQVADEGLGSFGPYRLPPTFGSAPQELMHSHDPLEAFVGSGQPWPTCHDRSDAIIIPLLGQPPCRAPSFTFEALTVVYQSCVLDAEATGAAFHGF